MSGESGGVIVGGILLIGAIPVVLAGAAAYGTLRLGIAATKAGFSAYQHHRERQRLEDAAISRELDGMYGKLQRAIDNQAMLSETYRKELAQEVQQAADRLEKLTQQGSAAVDTWQARLDVACEEMVAKVRQSNQNHRERVATQTRAEMMKIIAETESAREALVRSVEWESRKAEHIAMQKSIATNLLHEAQGSIRLLESLDMGIANSFAERVDVLKSNIATAQQHYDNGLWELCTATCQDVVFRSARLTLEQSQTQLEADEMRADVMARLEGLAAQLEACRVVQFLDEYLDQDATEDLNDFTQGEYVRQQQVVQDMLAQVRTDTITVEQLQALHSKIDNAVEGNVNTVIKTGHQRLLAYYKKMRTMEELAIHMAGQNYTMDWACTPNDDPTQPLSVRFTNNVSGNSVVVTLQDDMTTEDLSRMKMDLDVFFANGRIMTESEKQALRQHMTQALSAAGMQSNLSCQGRVNQESSRTERREEEAIRASAAQPLFSSTPAE